jgi:CheY-like chemotaxis protein
MVRNASEAESESARVMVVDDHPASAEMLAEVLALEGYAVAVAHSGQEAISTAREFKPSIALLDIGLPDMTGFALAATFRATAELRDVRLVALSGYEQSLSAQRSESAFEHYLVKPVEIDELLAVLGQLRASD